MKNGKERILPAMKEKSAAVYTGIFSNVLKKKEIVQVLFILNIEKRPNIKTTKRK
jgi:hypothetical protein